MTRTLYLVAYEEYSEVLRTGIQSEVEALAERIGHGIEAPPFDTDKEPA